MSRKQELIGLALSHLEGWADTARRVEALSQEIQIGYLADILASSAMPDPSKMNDQLLTLEAEVATLRSDWSSYVNDLALAQRAPQ
jgi:hypothetical protein